MPKKVSEAFTLTPNPALTEADKRRAAIMRRLDVATLSAEDKAQALSILADQAVEQLSAGHRVAYLSTKDAATTLQSEIKALNEEAGELGQALAKSHEAAETLKLEARAVWRKEILKQRQELNVEGFTLLGMIEGYYQRELELVRLAQGVGTTTPMLSRQIRMTPEAVKYLAKSMEQWQEQRKC